MDSITLSDKELVALTGYEQSCKQLKVLKDRGFFRAYISRTGGVVLERAHYETVSRGAAQDRPKLANLSFMRHTA